MKKILFGAAALLSIAALSSCNSGEKGNSLNDSLSTAYGEYVGTMLNVEFSQYPSSMAVDKTVFLSGLQSAVASDTAQSHIVGMQVGMQLLGEMRQLESQGIKLDRSKVINAFKKAFSDDSVSTVASTEVTAHFRDLYARAQKAAQEEMDKQKAEAPDAVQNGVVAKQAVEDLKAKNPEAKTTESGLAYVIEQQGEGATPDENATVVVNYTGKHLNGEVFDSSIERGEPATFNLQGVVPGFREGLMLLGKGGKATLYIPGELAYGINGQPAVGIGPNEMLVFEVELVDINPAK